MENTLIKIEEDWKFYFRQYDDGSIGTVLVNIFEAINYIPHKLMILAIEIDLIDQSGLPTDEGFESLQKLDDYLIEKIDSHKIISAGRVINQGVVRYYMYGELPELEAHGISNNIKNKFKCNNEFHFLEDLDHQIYFADLFPLEHEWVQINDSIIFRNLIESDVNTNELHSIEHYAYFHTNKQVKKFIFCLKLKDYNQIEFDLCPKAEHECKYRVQFLSNAAPNYDDLTSRNIELTKLAEELGGVYDGWEITLS